MVSYDLVENKLLLKWKLLLNWFFVFVILMKNENELVIGVILIDKLIKLFDIFFWCDIENGDFWKGNVMLSL